MPKVRWNKYHHKWLPLIQDRRAFYKLCLVTALVVFISEFTLMELMSGFDLPTHVASFVDASLLVIILAPFLYVLIHGPLLHSIKALETSENHLQAILSNTPAMIYLKDNEGRYIFINSHCQDLLQMTAEEIIGKTDHELFPAKIAEAFRRNDLEALKSSTPMQFEERGPGKNSPRCYLSSRFPLLDGGGNVHLICGVSIDISERKQMEEQIKHIAHHDSLTGLPNRALFLDRLNHAQAQARRDSKPFAVLFLDLNRFKVINDNYGHDRGDEVLQEVAQRLKQGMREMDTVARMGGDEFTFILTKVNGTSDAGVVAKKILDVLGQPVRIDGEEHSIGGSIGIAVYPDHGVDCTALLKKADQAMYRAKSKGDRCYVFATAQANG